MLTEQQLKQRLNYVCGSDAPIVCNKSKYMTPIQLWKIKCGFATQEQIENPYTLAGSYLEEGIGQLFEHHTSKKIVGHDCDMIISKENPFMAANIDGRIDGENAIIEIKTAASNRNEAWGETGSQRIPEPYMLQLAHYMHVADVEYAYVAVLIAGHDFRWYKIDRNLKLEAALIALEKEFWDCVQSQTPPDVKTASDYIELNGTLSVNDEIVADDEIEICCYELSKLLKEQSEYDERIKKLQDKIKLYMQNKEKLVSRTGLVAATYRESKGPRRFDQKRFELDHNDLFNQYTSDGKPQRRFLFKKDNFGG